MGGGTAAALQVAQDTDAYVEFRKLLLDAVRIVEGATLRTLGDDDDARLLGLTDAATHELCQLVYLGHFLWYDGSLGATGNGRVLCQEASVAPHDLDKEDALVRVGRVAYAVDTLHDGVHGGVVANGGVGAVEVVVNGAGQSDDGEVELHAEVARASQRAISSDDHQCVNLFFLAGLVGLLHAFKRHELLGAGRLQDGSATGDDARHVFGSELLDLALDESVVATIDALDGEAVIDACAGHRTYGGIHAGSVASGGQNANGLNLTHRLIAI